MGQIVTLYSYKGGVGRSMALANAAVLLARWGYETLMVDWDLEAPGLENFFSEYGDRTQIAQQQGVVDILAAITRNTDGVSRDLDWRELMQLDWRKSVGLDWQDLTVDIRLPNSEKSLHLLTAGRMNDDYFRKVRSFDVHDFYEKKSGGHFVERLRREWKKSYDFVLIDSRTGITDIGGICTAQLPDLLVLLFTATEQGLSGVANVGKRATETSQNLPFDRLKLLTVPIASRFDVDKEHELSREWLRRSSEELADLYADWLPTSVKPYEMLDITKIPYSAYFSFGEKLAVIEEEEVTTPTSLSYAYETVAALIADSLEQLEHVSQLKDSRDEFKRLVLRQYEPRQEATAFMSYAYRDDRDGYLSELRQWLSQELSVQTGEEFHIFQDRNDISWGESWKERIEQSIDEATFLIPIITPSYFKSVHTRVELQRFLEREQQLGRYDLIFPIYYVDTPLLEDTAGPQPDELAKAIRAHQYFDWRSLRYAPFTAPEVRRSLAQLATHMRSALARTTESQDIVDQIRSRGEVQQSDTQTSSWLQRFLRSRTVKDMIGERLADIAADFEPSTHIVDPLRDPVSRDPHVYATITAAIEAATPGDKVLVWPGRYEEGIVIDKPLSIIGQGNVEDIVVQAEGRNALLFNATVGRVSNLTLHQMGDAQSYGVAIAQGQLELVECDISSQSLACVAIRSGADPVLRRNRIHDGKEDGVVICENGRGTLEDNEIVANAAAGLTIMRGGDPTLRRNRIAGNGAYAVNVHVGGGGTIEDNDLIDNAQGAWNVPEDSGPNLRRARNR